MKLEFSRQIFRKITQISNFIKIRPVGEDMFHKNGRTAMTNVIVAFHNFAKAPENE